MATACRYQTSKEYARTIDEFEVAGASPSPVAQRPYSRCGPSPPRRASHVDRAAVLPLLAPTVLHSVARAGLTKLPSVDVAPFRIAESPVHLECRLRQLVPVGEEGCYGSSTIIIGEVTRWHVQASRGVRMYSRRWASLAGRAAGMCGRRVGIIGSGAQWRGVREEEELPNEAGGRAVAHAQHAARGTDVRARTDMDSLVEELTVVPACRMPPSTVRGVACDRRQRCGALEHCATRARDCWACSVCLHVHTTKAR